MLAPRRPIFTIVLPSLLLALGAACSDDTGSGNTASTTGSTAPDDSTGTTVGDGDGDASTTDTTTSGDGDGTPTDSGEGYCGEQCTVDDDCTVNGMDIDFSCVDNMCTTNIDSKCTSDPQCVAMLSGWTVGAACTSQPECDASMTLCIAVEGEGHCAIAPTQFLSCEDVGMEEVEVPDIDGFPAIVCGRPDAKCTDQGYCIDPCTSDADCPGAPFPICNLTSGLCECGSDSDCAATGEPRFSVCINGLCGCGSDQHCIDANVGDLCTSVGVCGCTDDAACVGVEGSFDGTTPVCVPLG